VVKRSREKRETYGSHVDDVREISENAIRALTDGDAEELGSLMDRNHELLVEIGVSHPRLDKLVKIARARGALGAKLTGAGGGGCIIALCKTREDEASIARALRRNGGIPYRVGIDREGARSILPGTVLK
jgi:mevalonate kinase